MTDQGLHEHHDADIKRTPHYQTLDRHESQLSYNNVGGWDRPRTPTGLIVSRTVEGFLMGQPELHDALAEWASTRFPAPTEPGEPWRAVFTAAYANPGDLRHYAERVNRNEEASLLIDGRFLFSFGYRRGYIGETYTTDMIGGLLIRRSPDGAYDFSTNT